MPGCGTRRTPGSNVDTEDIYDIATVSPWRHCFGKSGRPDVLMRASGQITWRRSALVCTSPHALAAEQSNAVETSTFIGVSRLVLPRGRFATFRSMRRSG